LGKKDAEDSAQLVSKLPAFYSKKPKEGKIFMFTPNDISEEIAAQNAIYAMLSCNAYHETDKLNFPVEAAGWQLVDLDGDPSTKPTKDGFLTGFAYDIYEEIDGNKSVIAFRGTDSKKDWALSNLAVPFSIPYKQAWKAVRKYLEKNPSRNLILTGHSLGGGMALSASVHFGVPAIVFDPSPRIFDGLGDYHEPATRVIIYQNGEVLERLRELINKAYDVVKTEDIYVCHFDFEKANEHRIDILAKFLAIKGMERDIDLKKIIDKMSDRLS